MYGIEEEATVPKAEEIPIPIPLICVGNISFENTKNIGNYKQVTNLKMKIRIISTILPAQFPSQSELTKMRMTEHAIAIPKRIIPAFFLGIF